MWCPWHRTSANYVPQTVHRALRRAPALGSMSGPPLAADPLRSGRGIFELQSFASIRSPMPKATMGARIEPVSSPRESPRPASNRDGHQIHEEFQRLSRASPAPKATMGARLEPKSTMPPPPPPPPGQCQVDVRPSIPSADESLPRVSGLGAASPTPTPPGAPPSTAAAASPLAPSPRQRVTPTRLPEGHAAVPPAGATASAPAPAPAPVPAPAPAPSKTSSKGGGAAAKAKPSSKERTATVTLKP